MKGLNWNAASEIPSTNNPLNDLDEWEDFLEGRYSQEHSTQRAKDDQALPAAGPSAVFRPTNIHGAVLDKIFLRSRFYDPWGFQSFTQFKTLLKKFE